jgi:hypothetical protein
MDGVTDLALRELGLSAVPTLAVVEVMRTLRQLTDLGLDTDLVSVFETSHARLRAEARGTATQETTWTFYWPLKVRLADSITGRSAVTVLGTSFRFCRTPAVARALSARQLEPASLALLLQTSDRVDLPPVFLVASKKASNPDEAWRRLIRAFDTIRGLMEYGLGFGRMQISFGKPSPRSRVPHPDWVLIKNPAQPLQGWLFVTEARDDGPFTFEGRHLDGIRRLAKEFRKSPHEGSTLALIADALRLYAQAMEARHQPDTFLGLWQLAERITLADASQGRTQEVCARLAWLVSDFNIPGFGLSHVLDDFAKMRNDIVHRGDRGELDDEDVNLLKRITEHGLLWLIRQHRRLPNRVNLEVLYQLRNASTAAIHAHTRTARFIMRLRAHEAGQHPKNARPSIEPPARLRRRRERARHQVAGAGLSCEADAPPPVSPRD